jgi:hypothetical protein
MKILMAAIALVIASPAVAQPAPAAQPDHGRHRQGHPQGHAQHGQQPAQHQGHAGQGDCCADRNGNGRMDCCEGMAEAGDRRGCCAEQGAAQAPAAHPQGHDGH